MIDNVPLFVDGPPPDWMRALRKKQIETAKRTMENRRITHDDIEYLVQLAYDAGWDDALAAARGEAERGQA